MSGMNQGFADYLAKKKAGQTQPDQVKAKKHSKVVNQTTTPKKTSQQFFVGKKHGKS